MTIFRSNITIFDCSISLGFKIYLQIFLSVVLSLFGSLGDIFKLLNQIVGYIFSFKACFLAKILGEKYLSGKYFFIALGRLLILINLHHSSQQATNCERSSSSSAPSLYEDYLGYYRHRNGPLASFIGLLSARLCCLSYEIWKLEN